MNIKSVLNNYKPSALDYIEISLLAVCLLLHHMSWASITADGQQLLEFKPFELLGNSIVYAVYVMFIVAIGMKFVGRYSGLTLLIVVYLATLVDAAHKAFTQGKEMLEQMQAAAEFGNGLSGMFGSFAGSTTSRSGVIEHSLSMNSTYIIVGFLAGFIAVCLLISWILSICRLASLHRLKLTHDYYISMSGYALIIVFCFVALKMLGMSGYSSLNEVMAIHGVVAAICMSSLVIGLSMLLINAVVVSVIEFLRERPGKRMALWSLCLALFFLVLFVVLNIIISLSAASMPSSISDLLKDSFVSIVGIHAILMCECLFLTAVVTCLLRAIYYGFFHSRKGNTQANIAIGESPDEELSEDVTKETVENDGEHNEDANSKWYYIGGVAFAVLLIGILSLFLFKGCNNTPDNLLSVQKPSWKKFVMVTSDNVALYKEPNSISPKLMLAMENVESDMCDFQFRWEDQGKKRGYTVSDYEVGSKTVLPVIEGAGEWYKVHVESAMAGVIDAYINKKWCQEVKPQPITDDILERIDKASQRCDYVVNSGKLKGLCFSTSYMELEGESFEMGQLVDGTLIFPESKGVLINHDNSSGMAFKKNEEYAGGYLLTYGDDRLFRVDESPVVFDTHSLTKNEVEEIYQAIKIDTPKSFEAYYYFPESEPDCLISFSYSIDNSSATAENIDDRPEEGVKNYTVSGEVDEEMQQLMAELDEEKVFAGVSNEQITIIHEEDLDGDGYNEVLVSETCNGNSCIPEVYVVYYDKNAKEFKQTNRCESYVYPETETWKGITSFVQSYGIRKDRYIYEKNMLKLVETDVKPVGRVLKKWIRVKMFEESEYGEKEVSADIDGDGINEVLVFAHNDSFACGNGRDMYLTKIKWEDGRSLSDEYFGVRSASSFALLETMTNEMHDLLLDDAYLFHWNGTAYEAAE